jgi:hypothetical protein
MQYRFYLLNLPFDWEVDFLNRLNFCKGPIFASCSVFPSDLLLVAYIKLYRIFFFFD